MADRDELERTAIGALVDIISDHVLGDLVPWLATVAGKALANGGIDLGGGRLIAIIEPARWSDEDGDGWRVMLSDAAPADIDLNQEPDVDFVPDGENWLTYDVPLFRIVTPGPEEGQ